MSVTFCPLPHVGCIEAEGADAEAFLHGQLSLDVKRLEPERAPLAGWHDARGRLRALFRVLRLPDRFLLLAPRAGLEDTATALRRFVLRARVALRTDGPWRSAALVGDADDWLAGRAVRAEGADALRRDGALLWLRHGESLWQAVGDEGALAEVGGALPRGSSALGALAEIRLGIPELPPALAERYLPQMLHLDRLGAVSFDKGCYPGQEVITRIRYRGAVKRHLRRYRAAGAPPAPGTPVVDEGGGERGEVLRAAPADDGSELLAVVEDEAAPVPLFLGPDRTPLTELPLPYIG
ncbi:MAG TPA: hypothetical protein VIN61_14315 [Gammaproteobacteria bacterium]